jgi:hypothetical protein
MLIGFGGYGQDPALPSAVTGAAIAQLGPQMTGAQQCSGDYCLSKQSHLDGERTKSYVIGAAVGAAAGALAMHLMMK